MQPNVTTTASRNGNHILYGSSNGFLRSDRGLHKVFNAESSLLNDLIAGKRVQVCCNDSKFSIQFTEGFRQKMVEVAKQIDAKIAENIPIICEIAQPSGWRDMKDHFVLTFFADPSLPSSLNPNRASEYQAMC